MSEIPCENSEHMFYTQKACGDCFADLQKENEKLKGQVARMGEALKLADRYNADHSQFDACLEVSYFNEVKYALSDYDPSWLENVKRDEYERGYDEGARFVSGQTHKEERE